MKRRNSPTTESSARAGLKGSFRNALSATAVVLAVALWLRPAPAQEHGTAPAQPHAPAATAPAGEHAPAATAPAGEQAPAGDHSPATTTPSETSVTVPSERGTHEGAQEPGPGGQHGPQGGVHEVGEQPGHGAEGGHGAGDAHGAEGAHGEGGHGEGAHGEGGHGEGEHAEEFSIHLPSWIYGPLKKFWYAGPATLSASGALNADGQPLSAEEIQALTGQRVEFTYHDHHSHANPKPEYHIQPVIGSIGTVRPTASMERETIQVNGQPITLLQPTVAFARESMFPELLVISLLTALTIAVVAVLLTRNLERLPSRRQTVLEMIYTSLDGFTAGLIGPHYKKYLPLVGTVFIYIFIMNVAGIIPGWASPTANINVTAGLAIVVVTYVQIEGIRANGLKGYFMHFVGDPWWLGPLNVPIHVIGEFAKILSLTIRLFGNLFGEDVVIVILISLGAMFTKGLVPFQFPMLFLALFTSFVQAMVFSILTCVYIALMTTHEDHGGHHGEHGAHGHDHDHGHAHEAAPAHA